MDFRNAISTRTHPSQGVSNSVLRDRWWWAPLAALYRIGLQCRHWAFDHGIPPARKGPLPTVVLGNVTVGGTGKTPHLKALLRHLMESEKGIRWAVLSRGYGRKSEGCLLVDREGTPEEFGDEPLEIARKFPDVPVYVSEDRLEGLDRIAKSGRADAVILDDGFQHRRLIPTVSIVLVDTTQPVDKDHFIPRGRLRDLPERVPKADVVILSRCASDLTRGDLRLWRHRLLMTGQQQLLHTGTRVEGLRAMANKRYAAWPMRCIAVSGIANPAQFEGHVARNCQVLRHFAYPDHQEFTEEHVTEWRKALAEPNGRGQLPEAIITTEKDVERIRPIAEAADLPILVLHLNIHWWDEAALEGLLSSIYQRIEASQSTSDI